MWDRGVGRSGFFWGLSGCLVSSFCVRTPVLLDGDPFNLTTSFNLIDLFKDPVSKCSQCRVSYCEVPGVRTCVNLRGDVVQPTTEPRDAGLERGLLLGLSAMIRQETCQVLIVKGHQT